MLHLIEDDESSSIISDTTFLNSKENTTKLLGYLNFPLFPLAKNQKIAGTFPITDVCYFYNFKNKFFYFLG